MLLWSLVGLPLVAGVVLALLGRRADRTAPVVAVAVAVVATALAVTAAVLRPTVRAPLLLGVDAGLAVDGLSAVLVVTVAVVAVAVAVYSAGELGAGQARARFFGLLLMFVAAMLVTVTATTLATLLMAWEAMGATSYALIGYWWRDPERVGGGLTAFLTTRAADLGLYLAAGAALAGGVPGLRLDALAEVDGGWRDAVAGGVVLAALGKSAQLPFSFWLSRAMAGPSPVSALLHSATMVAAGAYLLLRVGDLLAATVWAGPLVAWVGVLTALGLGAVALAQRDLKQLLAASTCSQLGVVVLAAGVGGAAAGTGQLVAHAATKSLLFLAAGAWLTALGTRDLVALRGAARRYPGVGAAATAGLLTLAGVPPLSLWLTKDQVLAAALEQSSALYVLGLLAAGVSAAYSAKALLILWAPLPAEGETAYDIKERGTRHVTGLMTAPLAALSVLAVALGATGLWIFGGEYRRLLGASAEPAPAPWEYASSAAVVLAVLVAATVLSRRPVRAPGAGTAPLLGWLGLERAAHAVVVDPAYALAGALARFDDRWVDGGVRAVAALGSTVGRLADTRVEVSVDGVVRAVAAGTRRLGSIARRPQTGQLHQYYAQAVVVLAVLSVLLILVR